MKKVFILIGITIMICSNLFAFEIINNDQIVKISLEEIKSHEMITLNTERNKGGVIKNDEWRGADLISILEENNITDFDLLKFHSSDNYMVRISKEQLTKHKPILAIFRNNEELDEKSLRLVAKDLRDMFWIQGITKIKTESAFSQKFPHTIFFAEEVLKNTQMRNLLPFKNAKGYTFSKLVNGIFPKNKEFYVIGRDGVSHTLEFENYLSQAVLIYDEGKYHMKSVQMPAGMWVNDIAAIIVDSKAIIFNNQFDNIQQITELLAITSYPKTVTAKSTNSAQKISIDVPFSSVEWQDVIKFSW